MPTLVIGVALSIGLAWTPDPSYGLQKVVKFWSVTLLATAAPFFLFETRRDLMVFLGSVAGLAAFVAAIAPFVKPQALEGITTELDTQGRYSFGGQIFPARLITTGVLILLVVPTFTAWRLRWLCVPVAIGMFVISLGFGSRGPTVSFVVALALVIALSTIRNPRYLAVVAVIGCLGIAVFPFISLPETARQRLTKTASDPTQVLHDDLRYDFYRQAIDLTGRYPLTGIGTGGFAVYSSVLAKQEILYPHNIFLELSSELGLIIPLFLVFTLGRGAGTTSEAGEPVPGHPLATAGVPASSACSCSTSSEPSSRATSTTTGSCGCSWRSGGWWRATDLNEARPRRTTRPPTLDG